jgi:hypothetical protein
MMQQWRDEAEEAMRNANRVFFEHPEWDQQLRPEPSATTPRNDPEADLMELIQRLRDGTTTATKEPELATRMPVFAASPAATLSVTTPPANATDRPDGPCAPTLFVWQGKEAKLSPIPYSLVEYLWKKPNHTAEDDDVFESVWGAESPRSEGALKSAIIRANNALAEKHIHVVLNRKAGHVVLTVHI